MKCSKLSKARPNLTGVSLVGSTLPFTLRFAPFVVLKDSSCVSLCFTALDPCSLIVDWITIPKGATSQCGIFVATPLVFWQLPSMGNFVFQHVNESGSVASGQFMIATRQGGGDVDKAMFLGNGGERELGTESNALKEP